MSIWSRFKYSRPVDTLEQAFGFHQREFVDTKSLLHHIGFMSILVGSISAVGGTIGVVGGAIYLGQKEDQEVQAPDLFGVKGFSVGMSKEQYSALYSLDCLEFTGYPARVTVNLEMLIHKVPVSTMDGLEGTVEMPEAGMTCREAANPHARRDEVHHLIGEIAAQPEQAGLTPKDSLETQIDMNMAELEGVFFERVVV